MKKILFVLPHMLCGGVEKALFSLVHEMPKDEYDISIMVVKSEGEFVDLVPDYVHYSEIPLNSKIREGLMLGGIKASLFHYARNMDLSDLCKVIIKIAKKDPIAVCFHIHMPFLVRYVVDKVNAKVKYAWIHNDFKKSGFDVLKIKYCLDRYDHYFAVSEQLLEEFVQIFPEYKEKASVAHNIVSEVYIKSNISKDSVTEYNSGTLNLLTIGRLDKQKGYDLAVKACRILKNKGLNFHWYVLGSGTEERTIKKMIRENDVNDHFHLLGIRTNPYPYINNCDIYVQPSRHEGYGIAVAEARMLNKPIICTDFTGARDQIINGYTGSIVKIDAESIAEEIEDLAVDSNKRKRYENNLSKSVKSYDGELKKIMTYFDI